jgi:hypothetical protein
LFKNVLYVYFGSSLFLCENPDIAELEEASKFFMEIEER